MLRTIMSISFIFFLSGWTWAGMGVPLRQAESSMTALTGNNGLKAIDDVCCPTLQGGQCAIAAIGMPVYLAFKAVPCGDVPAVAVPIATIIELASSAPIMGDSKLGKWVIVKDDPLFVLSPSPIG